MVIHRPNGIIILATILITLAITETIGVIEILNSIILQKHLIAFNAYLILNYFYTLYMEYVGYIGYFPWFMWSSFAPLISGSLRSLFEMFFISNYYDTSMVLVSTFLGLNISASIGLLSMRSWGRYLALIIGIIFIIATIIIFIFSFVFLLVMGGLQIVIGLVLIDVSKLVYFFEVLWRLWPFLIINFPILGWILFLYLGTDVKKLFK